VSFFMIARAGNLKITPDSRLPQALAECYVRSIVVATSVSRFDDFREKLHSTASLAENWNSYGAEPPNELARKLAFTVLQGLEKEPIVPSSLLPAGEGGITISFVRGAKRAMLEIYNTGEVLVAKYSASDPPQVWEFELTESRLRDSIDQIRTYLDAGIKT